MLSAENLVAQIDSLMREYPELSDDEELRSDVLEGETEIKDVLVRLAAHVQQAEADDAAIGQLGTNLAARRKRFKARAAFFRALIYRVMNTADLKKQVLPNATLSIRQVPPRLIVTDETQLPQQYVVTINAPDKQALKAALDAGEQVPGAELSNGGTTLSLRV